MLARGERERGKGEGEGGGGKSLGTECEVSTVG